MMKSFDLGLACPCCASSLANADTSGCEFNCTDTDENGLRHVDRLCEFGLEPDENAVVGDAHESVQLFRCVGCGDDVLDYAYEIHVLYPFAEGDEER